MKQFIKRVALLFCAVLLIGALAATASAATVDSGKCGDNVKWVLDDAGTLTISGTGPMADFTSPWRANADILEKVVVQQGVTHIGDYAFDHCSNLTSISLGDNVESIGEYAFRGCVALADIELGSNLTQIGVYAFESCESLRNITIPGTVTAIKKNTFRGCGNLQSVSISNGVTTIGYGAFQSCTGLKKITLPDSVQSVGDYAFDWCVALTEIKFGSALKSIGDNAFYGCHDLRSLTFPSSLVSIDRYAFAKCSSLQSVTIPANVECIGSYAFTECNALTSVTIKNGVKTVDAYAFKDCHYLDGVVIPDSVTEINAGAFENCFNLTRFTFGDGVKSLGPSVFEGCINLRNITIPGNVGTISSSMFSCCESLMEVTIEKGVTVIEDYAFNECLSLQHITIPDGVTYIGKGAFQDCISLQSISIPNSATNIKKAAFQNCISLKNVVLPKGITDVDDYMFDYCSSLTSIVIPGTVEHVGDYAFGDCSKLKEITFLGDAPSFKDPITNGVEDAFWNVTATAYYPRGNNTWTNSNRLNYGGKITWESYGQYKITNPTLEASNIPSTGKIELTWNAVPYAAKYEVFRATSKTGNYSCLGSITRTSYADANTELGKTYYYKVRAVAENGSLSDWSNIVSKTGSLIQPKVSATNIASSGKVKLSWSAVEGAVNYELYRATYEDGAYSKIGSTTSTSIINSSGVAGTTYYYKVRAVHSNTAANSAYSAVVSRTCDLPQPTGLTATNVASTGKIKLSWTKVEGAAKYEIYRATSKDGTYTKLSTTTGTSLTNTSVEVGKIYYYKVKAIHSNSAANSAYSSVVSRACDLPRPEVKVSNVASTGKIKLSWEKIDGATSYAVYRATSKDGTYTKIGTTTNTTLTNTSPTAGKTYYYKVKANHSNSAANSAYSSIVSRTCDLAQPTLTVKLNSSGKPVLTWNKVEGAVSYKVYRATSKDGTYSLVKTLTGTTLTNAGLTEGKTYYYKVKAIHSNTAANSAYSAIKSVTVK